MIFNGAIFVAMVIFLPGGIVGAIQLLGRRLAESRSA
jgi:ABC-type branched-subunit amino acid transport system permease subunit